MISLEQIRTLETKVHKAVNMLTAVQEENQLLRSKLGTYENRIEELEFMIEEFKEDQSEIEQGIISALNHLDHLEDAVGGLKGHGQVTETANSAIDDDSTEQSVEADIIAEAEESVSVATPESIPAWEAGTQEFQQPAPAEYESTEEASPEAQTAELPVRNQQLDIF